MRMIRFAKISILLTAILVFLGSTLPMPAGELNFVLNKMVPQAHFDVFSGPGPWSFHIEITGKVNSLSFPIKNSAPGAADFCPVVVVGGIAPPRNPKGTYDWSTNDVPAAVCQVCGSQWFDTNGDALALVAYLQTGDKNASVAITVTFPDPLDGQLMRDVCP